MQSSAREHVPALTAIVSLVAIGLVVTAAGGLVPSGSLPMPSQRFISLIPSLNVLISLAAIGTILAGWRWIRRGNVSAHRRSMLGALVLFTTFLALYCYRLITIGGATPFEGPAWVYSYVYLPVLATHILLALVCIPLLVYVLLLAMTRPESAIYQSPHRRVGRIAAPLWITSFALGIVVYALVHTSVGLERDATACEVAIG
ncbi:MAG: DUF420 domain-containing protein [Natrialbaceae archaeon]|nr:DUF420 domain-containing protein [Natrialbaceae archaeon]